MKKMMLGFHDTSPLLYVADSVNKGCRKVCVRSVDTDVVMLAIATMNYFCVVFVSDATFKYNAISYPSAC